VPVPVALVVGVGVSIVVTAWLGVRACGSSDAAMAGVGAGPDTDAFWKKIAPKIAAHTTIASADAIAARRIVRPPNLGMPQAPGRY
jgi:hypothetical protein